MRYLTDYWWLGFGLLGSVTYLRHLVKRRGGNESLPRRIILALNPKVDPRSNQYDPGLFGRQLVLLLIAAISIFLALLVAWLLDS